MQNDTTATDIIAPDKVTRAVLEGLLRDQFGDVRHPSQYPFSFEVYLAGLPIRLLFPQHTPIAIIRGWVSCRTDRQEGISREQLAELVLEANRRPTHVQFKVEDRAGVSYRHCMSYAWGFSPSYLTFLIRHTATIGGLVARQCDEHGLLDPTI